MKNVIVVDKEKNTISGVFHIERGGSNEGEWKFNSMIEISDMTPLTFSKINKLSESIAEELVYGLCLHAMNQ